MLAESSTSNHDQLNGQSTQPDDRLSLSPTANPVFYRTYSRIKTDGSRETFNNTIDRTQSGLATLGQFTATQADLTRSMHQQLKVLPSGRWLWCGGTTWSDNPANHYGVYNCSSTKIESMYDLVRLMDLSMCGAGVGWLVEDVKNLPKIQRKINLTTTGDFGSKASVQNSDLEGLSLANALNKAVFMVIQETDNDKWLYVGDSRQGWCQAYHAVLELFSTVTVVACDELNLTINFDHVRKPDALIKGFGGKANPNDLVKFFQDITAFLNDRVGKSLTPTDVTWLACRSLATVVAGNIRRSAGIAQASNGDEEFDAAKTGMWTQNDQGQWVIDPTKDAFRMANFTKVYHHKPTLEEVVQAVTTQYYSSEGAIQYAPEAIARGSADILSDPIDRANFIDAYSEHPTYGAAYLSELYYQTYGAYPDGEEMEHRLNRYGLNPCGEELLYNNLCNLAEVHLNQLDPFNFDEQTQAFEAAALSVAALLHHKFEDQKYQRSRELDPRVQVSFTGLFDFFVQVFGVDWLKWWEAGRPETEQGLEFKREEQEYFTLWQRIVYYTLKTYCDKHDLKMPNRYTGVQPAGTKSLLTGASAGWHPPKAQRYIRRITFQAYHPVALACIDYGYAVVPSQSCKDDSGTLLDDPFDPRVHEWLVEIPIEVSWASLPGADQIVIENFSALAQFDFYMQVQNYYTTCNTSATIELREDEITPLATAIYKNIQTNGGYISAALQARFDAPFPRLPFEKIELETYTKLQAGVIERRKTGTFYDHLMKHDQGWGQNEGASGCDSDKCLLPLAEPTDGKPDGHSYFEPVDSLT